MPLACALTVTKVASSRRSHPSMIQGRPVRQQRAPARSWSDHPAMGDRGWHRGRPGTAPAAATCPGAGRRRECAPAITGCRQRRRLEAGISLTISDYIVRTARGCQERVARASSTAFVQGSIRPAFLAAVNAVWPSSRLARTIASASRCRSEGANPAPCSSRFAAAAASRRAASRAHPKCAAKQAIVRTACASPRGSPSARNRAKPSRNSSAAPDESPRSRRIWASPQSAVASAHFQPVWRSSVQDRWPRSAAAVRSPP